MRRDNPICTRLPTSTKMLSCRTAPCACVPKLDTEVSPALPAQPSCRYLRALQSPVQEQMPAPAAQPCTGQVVDEIANTPRNGRVRPPQSCYSYCMISPIRGDRTEIRVQVPPRTRYIPRSGP